MDMKRIVAATLALVLSTVLTPVLAQQQTLGSIAGRATDEARRPYNNYVVQLRDADTGQVVHTTPLDAQGRYQFSDLPLSRHFLVELYNVQEKRMVCTEGPQTLTADVNTRNDLNIDCGAAPAAAWLLAAAAGAVAAVGVVTQSASE